MGTTVASSADGDLPATASNTDPRNPAGGATAADAAKSAASRR
nr:hypothetical protein [Corynebacterium xerosis]